ncbi:MAG: hypothetical protein AB7F19_02600 [Candidatus Babeliales bacterium]
MEPDARKLFHEKINLLLNTEVGKADAPILPNNPAFDDADIDFVKLKKELKRCQERYQDS